MSLPFGYHLFAGEHINQAITDATASLTAPAVINANAGMAPVPPANTVLQLVGADAANLRQTIDTFAGAGILGFRRSEGTAAAPVATGIVTIGAVQAMGYGATASVVTPRAAITFASPAVWSDASNPTFISFSTTYTGSITQVEAMRIQPSGDISIGYGANPTDSGYRLDVNGAARIGSTLFTSNVGFNGSGPVVKPTVTGAKGSNAALASLVTALASYGLITDSTTA